MKTRPTGMPRRKAGFTLTELLVSSALSVIVMGAAMAVVWMAMTQWFRTELLLRLTNENSGAVDRLVYGSQGRGGLREADAATVIADTNGWTLTYCDADEATNVYRYSRRDRTLTYLPGSLLVCGNVALAEAITNNRGDGLTLRMVLQRVEGRFHGSNDVSTFVQFRNRRQE